MTSRHYSKEFKAAAVKKLLLPGGPSLRVLSEELGLSKSTLYDWLQKHGKEGAMNQSNKNSPHSWPAEKKLQAIIETSQMNEEQLGEYLRKHGLHSTELEEWKNLFLNGFKGPGRPKLDPEVQQLREDNKNLSKDLRRKDKALAEMSARVVLLKKSRLIWGDGEDDE